MQHKPLAGVRVLEVGAYISAPYASSLLCALGADVVKVERPVTGEDFRRLLNDRSPYFRQYNAGKRSVALDLKSDDGVALVKALIPRFDVLIENLRPGKMNALGLGAAACTQLRSDLIYVSVSGFGNGGPLEQRAAYDTIGQAAGGLTAILSDAHSAQLSGTCLADLITGLTTTTGVLAALVGRAATGSGTRVETSVMEAVSVLTVDAMTQFFEDRHQNPSRQSRHPQAQSFCLATATGEYIAIHLSSSQKFWIALLTAMGRLDWASDPRYATFHTRMDHYYELVPRVEKEFLKRSTVEWETLLTDADVPFSRVATMADFVEDPQTQWLELLEPEEDGLSLLRAPWKFDGTRPRRSQFTPKVGQHTREVAAEVVDDARIDDLVAAGVLFEDHLPVPTASK